jgi:hypothetical protein
LSVAFTKEDSAETASETLLPDRPVSAVCTENPIRVDDVTESTRIGFSVHTGHGPIRAGDANANTATRAALCVQGVLRRDYSLMTD